MAVYPERRVSKAAAWSRRVAVFSAVLFLTAGLGHRYGYVESRGFIAVLGVIAGLALLALVLAAYGFARLWNHADVGGRNLTVAIFVALLVLTPFGISAYRAITRPTLNDVSTDTDDPPELTVAMRTRTASMNPILPFTPEKQKLQFDEYPLVTGRRYEMPFDRVAEAVAKLISGRGWQVVTERGIDGASGEATIEAVAYTTYLGFPIDVAVRLIDEDTSSYVDMRSTSRYGEHDFGDNATRIADFLGELDAEIAALAGVVPPEPAEAEPEDVPLPEPKPEN